VIVAHFLPLTTNVSLAVRLLYYPAQTFVAERCKCTTLTTKWAVLKVVKLRKLMSLGKITKFPNFTKLLKFPILRQL